MWPSASTRQTEGRQPSDPASASARSARGGSAQRSHAAPGATRPGKTVIDQVVMVYEYPVDIQLKGREFGEADGCWLSIWGGGTLVFGHDGSLRHHARKPVRRERVQQVRDFLAAGLGRGYMGTTGTSFEDEIRRYRFDQPWMLALSGDEVSLNGRMSVKPSSP